MATASVTNTLVNGATVTHSEHNTNYQDLVDFLNVNVLHRDGSKAMTGPLDMGSQKITLLAAGSSPADGVRFDQLDDKVTFETLDGKGDVGTGANQLAEGNHAHSVSIIGPRGGTLVGSSMPSLTGSWVSIISGSTSKPSGWGSTRVVAWATAQYAACNDGLQLNARIKVDSTTGSTAQSGSANSVGGSSGVVVSNPMVTAVTSDSTINFYLDAYASTTTGGTPKHAFLNYILLRET